LLITLKAAVAKKVIKRNNNSFYTSVLEVDILNYSKLLQELEKKCNQMFISDVKNKLYFSYHALKSVLTLAKKVIITKNV